MQIETSKTGISHSDVVNEAIDQIIEQSRLGTQATAASHSYAGQQIPVLLKKRLELQAQGAINIADPTVE